MNNSIIWEIKKLIPTLIVGILLVLGVFLISKLILAPFKIIQIINTFLLNYLFIFISVAVLYGFYSVKNFTDELISEKQNNSNIKWWPLLFIILFIFSVSIFNLAYIFSYFNLLSLIDILISIWWVFISIFVFLNKEKSIIYLKLYLIFLILAHILFTVVQYFNNWVENFYLLAFQNLGVFIYIIIYYYLLTSKEIKLNFKQTTLSIINITAIVLLIITYSLIILFYKLQELLLQVLWLIIV